MADALGQMILDNLGAITRARPGLLAGGTVTPRTDEAFIAAIAAALAPVPVPAPVPAPAGHRDLGPLPAELATALRWPAPPAITRTVLAADASALGAALGVAGTRVRVAGTLPGPQTVRANDIEIALEPGASIGRVTLAPGVRRVRITGGAVQAVELPTPANWSTGSPVYNAALFAEDVAIDRVRMVAPALALTIRGKRIAITDCDVTAQDFSLWCGDTGPYNSEDLIVAGCKMTSAGPQATLRMHDIIRSVVVDCRLSNPVKHNYRVHGRSDLAWCSRNVLVHAGQMLGTEPGDACGTIWVDGNTFYHDLPSLLELVFPDATHPRTIQRLTWSRNTVYSDVLARNGWPAWIYAERGAIPTGWTVEGNVLRPYQPAP